MAFYYLTDQQHATVLAALRVYQQGDNYDSMIDDLASNGGQVEPLTKDQIDELCEEINTAGMWPGLDPAELSRAADFLDTVANNISDDIHDSVDDDDRVLMQQQLDQANGIAAKLRAIAAPADTGSQKLFYVEGFYDDDGNTICEDWVFAKSESTAKRLIKSIRKANHAYNWTFTSAGLVDEKIEFLIRQRAKTTPESVEKTIQELMEQECAARCVGCQKIFNVEDLDEFKRCEKCQNVCSDCGENVESLVGCPDGAEVCPACLPGH